MHVWKQNKYATENFRVCPSEVNVEKESFYLSSKKSFV